MMIDITSSSLGPISTDIYDLLETYNNVFQEHNTLPPTRLIDHAIDLFHGVSLPDAPLYHTSILQSEKIKHQIQDFFG